MFTRASLRQARTAGGHVALRKFAHQLEARLGNLLQMPKRRRSARPPAQQSAEVIMFTGVRYERNGTPANGPSPLPTKPAGAAPRKRRRG